MALTTANSCVIIAQDSIVDAMETSHSQIGVYM